MHGLLSASIFSAPVATSAAGQTTSTPTTRAQSPIDVRFSHVAEVAKTATDPIKDQPFAVHGQMTVVAQANLPFRSAFADPNSLNANGELRETADVTLYAGLRPWIGAEIWVNGELDQGFGLRNTLGAAGFPNGEAYKVGKKKPYPRLPRLFVRQTVNLGGEIEKVEADLNQLRSAHTAHRLILTAGKFGVTDVFDTNIYSHDPRSDFFNWSVIDAGTFDYAADAWG
jgi:high affinity Mn2+ porin